MQHPNFFETLKEAHLRLRGTVVLYDKKPYYVLAITDHKKDGIFRIYLDPIGWDQNKTHEQPQALHNYGAESEELGVALDQYLDANTSSPILRKQMNSPLFDKFRPFSLGMCNIGKRCVYTEWQPTRSTYQGLTRQNVTEHVVTLGEQPAKRSISGSSFVNTVSQEFEETITGSYPSAGDCLSNLSSGEFENEAVGFAKNFAFIRGPIDTIFLAYKTDVVGWLPDGDTSKVILGKKFRHTREVIEALALFHSIQVK